MTRSGIVFTGIDAIDGTEQLQSLPLEEVKVRVQIVDVTARVTLIQKFYNSASVATGRAKYCFPVPASAAICAFQTTTSDGRTIKGECKEKEEAREQFEAAVASGRTAGLLDYVTDDIFVISIGSFPQRTVIETRLVYVMTLYTGDYTDQVRFQLPKSVGERYGVPPSELEDAMQPSVLDTRISITAEIQMYGKIRDVVSPSHPGSITQTKYSTHLGRPSKRRLTVRYRSPNYLDKDFVLTVLAAGLDEPRCFAEIRRDPRHRFPDTLALQLTMVPRHKLPPLPSQEYIFVVDRSGSMSGGRIETARDVLSMMLRMIPSQDSTFNIFGFGTTWTKWKGTSQRYSQATLDQATAYSASLQADLGGTEVHSALQDVFRSASRDRPTAVFLFTDGEVYHEEIARVQNEAKAFVTNSNAPRRIFTLGIGHGVSTELCEGTAKAGNGECLYAVDSETIIPKCAKLFTAGRTPFVRSVAIDWGVSNRVSSPLSPGVSFSSPPSGAVPIRPLPSVQQAPHTIHSIHSGTRLTIYTIISLKTNQVPKDVTLEGVLDDETRRPFGFKVSVQQVSLFTTDNDKIPMIHTMAAWKLIQEHDSGNAPLPRPLGVATPEELRKSAITHLGTQYQVASKHTSFVAVEGIRDAQSGGKLKASFLSKHPEYDQYPVDQEEEPEEEPPNNIREAVTRNLERLGTLFSSIIPILTGSGDSSISPPTVPPARGQPPGSWPQDDEDPDQTMDLDDVPTRGSPPPSDTDSYESSVRTFSTLSSLNPSSGESDWSSIYSDSSVEEMTIPPSPRLEPQGRSASQRKESVHLPSPPIPQSVITLVKFQEFDGSFPNRNGGIARLVGPSRLEAGKELESAERDVWPTVLCVAFLKIHLRDNPEVLENLLVKAMEYLHRVKGRGVDIDKLFDHALSLF
ncbi:von Willebrand domain-containing protein [Coprinopsis marcescibilis]|uniref:von Willebrand domain-containing protein n=1 Tax=Coprinopsis marcescibilis TaxID=230819 RepID=A0A5C3LFP3_COPMA|nr:von Willebrand domain-containing protein [Coprinopsis marcescibilis]